MSRACGRRWRGWCWALLLAAALAGPGAGAAQAPAPLCPPARADRCQTEPNEYNEFTFIVDGKKLEIIMPEQDCFTLTYPTALTLDESALPRFEDMYGTKCAVLMFAEPPPENELNRHPLPANEPTYAAILRSLNVFVSEKLTIKYGTLSSEHLAGLTSPSLELNAVYFESTARDLRHLTGLRRLRLDATDFAVADLELLPTDLEELQLVRTGIERVPAAALVHRSKLAKLFIAEEDKGVSVEAAGGLRALTLQSDEGADVELALPGGLENLTITGWKPRQPRPWQSCAGLVTLELLDAAAETLPAGWVARCAALRTLIVTRACCLASLEEGALRGAVSLKHLSLTECPLESLPADLLEGLSSLSKLDLSDNQLLTLPSGLLKHSWVLTELTLSYNRLAGSALGALLAPAAQALAVLRLNGNSALDACPAEPLNFQQESKFSNLKSLIELDLSDTATTQVCPDWSQLPRLQWIGLKYTAIASIQVPSVARDGRAASFACSSLLPLRHYNHPIFQRADLRFNTIGNITVDLTGTNVTGLVFDREDWAAREAQGNVHVHMVLSEPLLCDCKLYWAAAALNCSRFWLSVEGARCAPKRQLRNVPLEEMVCAAPQQCPVNCTCGERDDQMPPGRVMRLTCAGAGLDRVPCADETLAALRGSYALDLQLADNSIVSLRTEDLPDNLTTLDLRNNSLSEIDAATVEALVSRADRRVLLAGNPLDCGCRAAALLKAVRSSPKVFDDRAVAACVSGVTLTVAAHHPPHPCRVPGDGADPTVIVRSGDAHFAVIVASALMVVVTVAVALALVLLRPELRLRMKVALRARGLLPRAHEGDDGRVYDAFVSFAHADEAVVRELVERLEGGAAPLRLCVHYRDWTPGGWIPTQIAASVRVSRRTVAVVSEAFLRSRWARAEFREAYAAALRDAEPRLVVVLLEDPARLPLDAELRAYLAANTYVRWGDPWFWPKLRRALPAPRRPARRPPTADTEACSALITSNDVSVRCAATTPKNALALSAPTPSTDVSSTRTAATASTDVSVRSAATVSSDVSFVRSAVTVSTDVSSTRTAATVSTDAPVQSAELGSTNS